MLCAPGNAVHLGDLYEKADVGQIELRRHRQSEHGRGVNNGLHRNPNHCCPDPASLALCHEPAALAWGSEAIALSAGVSSWVDKPEETSDVHYSAGLDGARWHSARFSPESPATTEARPPSPKSSAQSSPGSRPGDELHAQPVSLIGPVMR